MREREIVVVSGLMTVMLILCLGFAVHQDPRFAGSLWGGVLGVSDSLLMMVPLLYSIIKRVKALKNFVTRFISMPTLLAVHIYSGIVGPVLAILHTGHKFNSGLGIALTGMTITVVISGFVGRYLLSYIGREIKDKHTELDQLNKAYEQAAQQLQTQCNRLYDSNQVAFHQRNVCALHCYLCTGSHRDPYIGLLSSSGRTGRKSPLKAAAPYASPSSSCSISSSPS